MLLARLAAAVSASASGGWKPYSTSGAAIRRVRPRALHREAQPFVAATSIRRDPHLYGCNMPLGDPGRIDSPSVSAQQFALSKDTITGVKCMNQIGLTGCTIPAIAALSS